MLARILVLGLAAVSGYGTMLRGKGPTLKLLYSEDLPGDDFMKTSQ